MKFSVYSEKTLSIALAVSAAAWGLYWIPLRTIESGGITGTWSVVFFNACPLLILLPLLPFQFKKLKGVWLPTLLAAVLSGLAFSLYSNGLVETTVVRATLLYYLTPIWSTMLGVLWLSEPLTKARIISFVVAFAGLYLLLFDGDLSKHPLNIGDLYSFLSGIVWAFAISVVNRWSNIPVLPLTTLIFISTTLISGLFALTLNADSVPRFALLLEALPNALFWSLVVILPCFIIIFRVSQILFPGRVGILTMSEVVVAILSAAILLPEENLIFIQWLGAFAIICAGLIEVIFGYRQEETVRQL